MNRSAVAVIAALIVLATTGCGGPASSTTNPAPSTGPDQVSAAPTAEVSPPPAPALTELRDSIYLVGSEVRPGTYVTTVPANNRHSCYWARLRSFGQPDSIIDEGNPEPGETLSVVVLESDRGFKVANGCTWAPGGK